MTGIWFILFIAGEMLYDQLYCSATLLLILFGKDAQWAAEKFLTSWRREKSPTSAGIRTPYRPTHSLVTIPVTLFRMLEKPYFWKMYTTDPPLWRVCS